MRARALSQLPDYEFVERLGKGAHATISLAIHRPTRQRYAVKHIVRRGAEDERFIRQAETEYDVATKCEHAYLRRCHELVRVRKWLRTTELFLVMEYVDGDTLEHQCPDKLDAIVRIFMQVAEGLAAMHKAGFAHADIKPNNILLTESGLKIIDFGQSCPLGHRKERVQGTPDYMAPEQVLRDKIDHRTDVFNLGATMYWVVTGKAFKTLMQTAPTGTKMIQLESRRGNDPPHELNPQVPLAFSRLILECCETSPEARPRDMRDVIARLDVVMHLLNRDGGEDASRAPAVRR
ncbi:MAG: serine/threonine protein kinase [Phycisphaerae bacterium]